MHVILRLLEESQRQRRRKDEAWHVIDLNEVIEYEGNGKEYDVRAAAAAFG